MKSTHMLRKVLMILMPLIIIACGLFKPSDEIASLQSTIEALTNEQDTSQDNGEPPPPINTEGQTQATPEVSPTDSIFQNALEYVDQYGGSTNSVAVKGDYAYIGQGPRLVVLDVSNPGSPVFIRESELLPGLVMGVEVEGEYAYVTTMFSGLNIFDISQETDPKLISQVEPSQPGCGPLTLKDGIAYIGCNPSGLFIVDVNHPSTPTVLTSDKFPSSMISIALIYEHIYLADAYKGIYIIDISDPVNPKQVGFFEHAMIPSQASVYVSAVDACQGDLCMAVPNHGFVILDLSEPSNPSIKADITQFWPSGIITEGQYAYLVDDLEGVRVFDISNPSQPQQVGLMPTAVGGFEFSVHELKERGIFIADHILYIPDHAYGLTTVDIHNPSQPVRVGQYMTPVPDAIFEIEAVGNYVYTANRSAGFRVVDITDPENMREIFYDDARKDLTPYVPSGLNVIGNYIYISDRNYPLHVYDISNPDQPIEVGSINSDRGWDGADDLVISDNYAYLAGRGGNDAIYPGEGIWVIDISNPAAPAPIHFVDLPNSHWSLAIHNSILYALDGTQEYQEPNPISLRIIDIGDPAQPVSTNAIPISELKPVSPRDILVSGNWLYLGMGMDGIKLFDIQNPSNPIEVIFSTDSGIMPLPMRFSSYESHLFVNGSMAYDISNPTEIRLIGMGLLPMDPWDCDRQDDLVFIATSFQGIYVYRIN